MALLTWMKYSPGLTFVLTPAPRFFSGDAKRIDQSADFASGILDLLARLDAQRHGQFIEPFFKRGNAVIQNGLPLVRWHAPHRFGCPLCRSNRRIDVGSVGQRNSIGDLAGILVGNLQISIGSQGLIGKVKWIFYCHGLHFRTSLFDFVIQDSIVFRIVDRNIDQVDSTSRKCS